MRPLHAACLSFFLILTAGQSSYADIPGRLFFTPQQRATLDNARIQTHEVKAGPATLSGSVTFKGYARSSKSRATHRRRPKRISTGLAHSGTADRRRRRSIVSSTSSSPTRRARFCRKRDASWSSRETGSRRRAERCPDVIFPACRSGELPSRFCSSFRAPRERSMCSSRWTMSKATT